MQVARMPSAVVLGGTRPDRGGCPPEFRRRLVLQSWSHSDGPALPRVPAGFSPAFWRMARPIITVHGDHSNDEETRLGALSDDVRFDVLQGSWLHDALSLDRYPNNPLAPQYTAVPAAIPALALGVLRFGPDTGFVWFGQDSMPSAQRLNKIAVGVDASDIKFWDGERDQPYRSAFALREALAGFVAQHFDLADPDSPFLITGEIPI